MTRQEAIKILNKYDLNFCDINGNPIPPQDLAEAYDMAIEALQQEPTAEYSSDVISRQVVIEAIHSYFKDKLNELPTEIDEDGYEVYCDMDKINAFLSDNKHLSKKIKNLPSAKPKRGKWLPENADVPTYCSVCGHSWDEYIHGSEIWYTGDLPHFCPNCNADMRGNIK